jgi:hypothetical protein
MSKSNYLKLATDAGDQFLSTLAEGQDSFLKSLTTLSTTLSTPPPPPSIPAFATALPTIQEVTEANFSFAQKLLKQQKDFMEKLVAASTPASH